jgi:hypothetical protein
MRCYVFQHTSRNTLVHSLLDPFLHLKSPQKHIFELVRQSATHIMDSGGVVRKIDSWGTKTLPQRMRRHGPLQSVGEWVKRYARSYHV